ncbi:hypothetical protein, unlikely [Trypanosoma brucei gambiense DAL972]|uniref:Uncharacterized protein n=1 Tax=Trypanosoma brucei gambiense (strain MHOM/CI/86/DAL972) TaxID=679716 RepID=C9ZUC1_TRYB9|nr:hypothetical protein, unlikely [Trypanosoma brucei gambiense DAL972]CBH13008.1 hypothetical protein, unlikely [Trypanosoma brucei gambiense DAL972]|eukprot:XP_011775286.1 hypothetical protein, unlikely [Trypanosoma brucei gambiense DAL972]
MWHGAVVCLQHPCCAYTGIGLGEGEGTQRVFPIYVYGLDVRLACRDEEMGKSSLRIRLGGRSRQVEEEGNTKAWQRKRQSGRMLRVFFSPHNKRKYYYLIAFSLSLTQDSCILPSLYSYSP